MQASSSFVRQPILLPEISAVMSKQNHTVLHCSKTDHGSRSARMAELAARQRRRAQQPNLSPSIACAMPKRNPTELRCSKDGPWITLRGDHTSLTFNLRRQVRDLMPAQPAERRGRPEADRTDSPSTWPSPSHQAPKAELRGDPWRKSSARTDGCSRSESMAASQQKSQRRDGGEGISYFAAIT